MHRISDESLIGGIALIIGVESFTLMAGESFGTGLLGTVKCLFLIYAMTVWAAVSVYIIKGIGHLIITLIKEVSFSNRPNRIQALLKKFQEHSPIWDEGEIEKGFRCAYFSLSRELRGRNSSKEYYLPKGWLSGFVSDLIQKCNKPEAVPRHVLWGIRQGKKNPPEVLFRIIPESSPHTSQIWEFQFKEGFWQLADIKASSSFWDPR